MLNYVNYFTEIEQRFLERRGSLLLLSTLDWALIDTWREAGIPLQAVLRGIDNAFDRHEAQKTRARGRTRRINGLAWVVQAVHEAAEAAVDAATGVAVPARQQDPGFSSEQVAGFLDNNALAIAAVPGEEALAARLQQLAAEVRSTGGPQLEQLERTLAALEEALLARVLGAAPESELVALKEQSARELAPYRSRMQVAQLRQVERQFLHKRLFEARGIPRLSLFYLSHT